MIFPRLWSVFWFQSYFSIILWGFPVSIFAFYETSTCRHGCANMTWDLWKSEWQISSMISTGFLIPVLFSKILIGPERLSCLKVIFLGIWLIFLFGNDFPKIVIGFLISILFFHYFGRFSCFNLCFLWDVDTREFWQPTENAIMPRCSKTGVCHLTGDPFLRKPVKILVKSLANKNVYQNPRKNHSQIRKFIKNARCIYRCLKMFIMMLTHFPSHLVIGSSQSWNSSKTWPRREPMMVLYLRSFWQDTRTKYNW